MGEGESGSPSRAELVWVYHGLDNRWEGFESTTLCQGWTDPAAEAKWNNYFFRPGTEACAGADSETASYQLSVSERHSDTWLLNRSALCQASHCPSGMAEGMFLECTVPAWLLQYHGTFSDTLENCRCNERTIKSSSLLKLPGRLMWGLPSSLYLAFLICGSTCLCLRWRNI